MKYNNQTSAYTIQVIKNMYDVLNENGFRDKYKVGDDYNERKNQYIPKYEYKDWALYEEDNDPLSSFMGGLFLNPESFKFLKNRGLLDTDICWDCGKRTKELNYTFTDRFDKEITYKICETCYYVATGQTKDPRGSKNNSSACFIASACYDTSNSVEVQILREYRDNVLKNSMAGQYFIKFYYSVSPSLARLLLKMPKSKTFIKEKILNKLVERIK